jgi:hypothetical protein
MLVAIVAEQTQQVGSHIHISPDVREDARAWPDPRDPAEIIWRATYAPGALTPTELRWLAVRASSYAHIFELTQREFLPTHAAIRAHVRTSQDAGVEA